MQLLFATTLLLSAALMFVVEPMFARMVLPLLGGSPSVWNTCLVFYQAALLAGYIYAFVSVKCLGARRQAALHLALLCLPWIVLPIGIAQGWMPPRDGNPVPWLWMLLSVSLGLPFLVVSATAPLAQAWFAETSHRSAKDPYFLYAASNLGSMIGLAAYPLVIEPRLTVAEQSWWWAAGYGLLMALIAACCAALWLSRRVPPAPAEATGVDSAMDGATQCDAPLTLRRRLRWLMLALVPSSLLLGVTSHLSIDIAAVPLLWVIPLMLYLLSFVIVFARRRILSPRWAAGLQAAALALLAGGFSITAIEASQLVVLSGLHLLAFFLTCLVCHGELAADRPASRHLTEFYLWMSVGGVLGGAFNALVAPLVFTRVVEYPLMLVAAALLRPRPVGDDAPWLHRIHVGLTLLVVAIFATTAFLLPREVQGRLGVAAVLVGVAVLVAFLLQRRPGRFAVAVAVAMVVSLNCFGAPTPLCSARSFFGVLRVVRYEKKREDGKLYCRAHILRHGSTIHGFQSQRPDEAQEPCGYFYSKGPVGDIFGALGKRPSFPQTGRVGVVGLGTGAIAAYGKRGQRFTYFEIDPAVARIAWDPQYFSYLSDCRARGVDLEVHFGDARLTLADETDHALDVLFLDAFSSDAIPIHLLTREALELYFSKLDRRGLLAVHITNRHLDLEPVLANLAADLGLAGRIRADLRASNDFGSPSIWVVMARGTEELGDLGKDPRWKPIRVRPEQRLWTDDFSSLVSVVRFNLHATWLFSSKWWSGDNTRK